MGSPGDTQVMVVRAIFSEVRSGLNFFREEKKWKICFTLFCMNYRLSRDTGEGRRAVILPGAGL